MNSSLIPAVALTVAFVPALAFAQAAPPAARSQAPAAKAPFTQTYTPWGEPDLQGQYSNRTITPFERPASAGNREFFTPEEAANLEKQAEGGGQDENRSRGTRNDLERAYNDFWWDRGTKVTSLRTSLVVDPPDGKVPALTPEAIKRQDVEHLRPSYRDTGARGRGTDTYLDRGGLERCMTRGMPGAMSPTAYNNNYRITQSPGYVAIQIEMLGGTRVIPTDNRPFLNPSMRHLMGNSVGHWEGDTLVVETKHFTDKYLYRGAAENITLVERFRRVGKGELQYRVTVTDPTTFTRPFTLEIPYVDTGETMFEYACHEGNYGLAGILEGAREEEKAAAKTGGAK